HARLRADRMDVGARGPVAAGRQHAVVDLAGDVHLSGMNLEDRHTGFGTRHRDLDDAVEPSRPQKCFVEDVWTIRRPDDLDLSQRVESVQLREELHQRPLDLSISGRRDLEALGADRIELVDEDDGRGLLPGELEQLPHQAGAFADVFLHELGADEPDERGLRAVRDRLREERLAGPRRPDEQDALRGLDADLSIEVRFQEPIFFLFPPSGVLLEWDKLRSGVPFLPFHAAGGLHQLVVAAIERGDAHGHFLGEFADLIVVHRFARWVGYEGRLYTRHFLFSLCGPGS